MRTAEPERPVLDRVSGPQTAVSPPAPWSADSVGLILLLVVLTALGLFLRLWIIRHAPINSDEAVVGLMARGILHGHFTAFYWGQSYGGGPEPFVVAGVFAVAGQSAFTLALAPALLSAAAAVTVWRIGRRLLGHRAGQVAAVLAWIWSESSLRNATREFGFREGALVVGLLVLLQVLRIREAEPGGKGDTVFSWLAVGSLVGLGWWATPEIAYVALPAAAFLTLSLWHRPVGQQAVRLGAAAGGCVLGAAPWFVASFSDGFATLRAPGPQLMHNTYVDRLATFFSHVLPMILGLRVMGTGGWEVSPRVGVALYVLLSSVLVASLILLWSRIPAARPLVVIAATYPLLYAAFPSSWYWRDGRYAISLTPVVALVLVGGVWTAVSGRAARWASVVLLVAATASTLVAFNDSFGAITSPHRLTSWGTEPRSVVSSLGHDLLAHGVTDVYAGYWVAYNLQFISHDRISVSTTVSDRNFAESRAVEAATRAGWVFVGSTGHDRAVAIRELDASNELNPAEAPESKLVRWLTTHDIPYRTFRSGIFEVVEPSRNVNPNQPSLKKELCPRCAVP